MEGRRRNKMYFTQPRIIEFLRTEIMAQQTKAL
jgi:hypothetical protein